MSYNLLPLDHQQAIQSLPSYNRIHNTLLFIETVKNIPNHSLTCLDAPQINEHLHQEDSLGIEIKKKQKSSQVSQQTIRIQTPESKKKKNGCTCKKTKCLKMYCECFALGKMCTPECACYSCCNTDGHREIIQKAKQCIKSKSSRKNTQGCTCKKSQCQKKYCECFNAGVACSQACKCCDCQNHKGQVSSSLIESLNNIEGEEKKIILGSQGENKSREVRINQQKQLEKNKNNEIIPEALNSQNWVSQYEGEEDLGLNSGVNRSGKERLQLTSHKGKQEDEYVVQGNQISLRSFGSLDLCGYFN